MFCGATRKSKKKCTWPMKRRKSGVIPQGECDFLLEQDKEYPFLNHSSFYASRRTCLYNTLERSTLFLLLRMPLPMYKDIFIPVDSDGNT